MESQDLHWLPHYNVLYKNITTDPLSIMSCQYNILIIELNCASCKYMPNMFSINTHSWNFFLPKVGHHEQVEKHCSESNGRCPNKVSVAIFMVRTVWLPAICSAVSWSRPPVWHLQKVWFPPQSGSAQSPSLSRHLFTQKLFLLMPRSSFSLSFLVEILRASNCCVIKRNWVFIYICNLLKEITHLRKK